MFEVALAWISWLGIFGVTFYGGYKYWSRGYWVKQYKHEAERWAAMVDELQALRFDELDALQRKPAPTSNAAKEAEALRREIAQLMYQLQNKNGQIQLLLSENQAFKRRAETDINMHPAYADKKSTPFDDMQINRLIRLCHPDKHGNSEVANEVTSWLLSLRKPT